MDDANEKMIYEGLKPVRRETPLEAIEKGDIRQICISIESIAEYDAEWEWPHEKSIELLNHPSHGVRISAARSLGTLARIHPEMPTGRLSKC